MPKIRQTPTEGFRKAFWKLYRTDDPLFQKKSFRESPVSPFENTHVVEPSLYRQKTVCLDTDSRLRFSETLRTFTKTPQFGADVPDTSVPLFQPLRVRYPRNLQVAWRRRFPRVGFLKTLILSTLFHSTTFASRPRAKQLFSALTRRENSINIRVHGKRSEKGRGKKRSERGQKRTHFRTKRTEFTTKRTLFPHKWTRFQRKRTHLTSITQIGKGVPAQNFFSSSVAFSLPPH